METSSRAAQLVQISRLYSLGREAEARQLLAAPPSQPLAATAPALPQRPCASEVIEAVAA